MKLEFSSLNGLLHAALTYLCDEDCIIPGGANLPVGTQVTLEMSWPEGEQPVVVKGISGGLDPAGRGLLLDIQDPGALHQVVMIMTHLHFGPYVGRQLLDLFRLDTRQQDQIRTAPPAPAEAIEEEELPPPIEATEVGVKPPTGDQQPDDALRTALPSPRRVSTGPMPEHRRAGVRPPRLRPPVIRPPTVRPPAASTQLPRFSESDDEVDLTRTAIAASPELIAALDDLDDDY